MLFQSWSTYSANCMSKRKLPPWDEVARLYEEGNTLADICRTFGLSRGSRSNISRVLKSRYGIQIRKDAGENHHAWKGGRVDKGDGYVGIWLPSHERADHQGYVYEHTLVAERKYGRLPRDNEVIHHVDLDKHNNKPENLWLCNNKEHIACHRSIEALIKPLMDLGIIEFREGKYLIKENV